MDNIEEISCYSIKVDYDGPNREVVFDYADGLVCAICHNYLMIYEETDTAENVTTHPIRTAGALTYVKYLTIYNIVFLATNEKLILYDIETRKVLATRRTEKEIVELSWNHAETLLVVLDCDNYLTSYVCSKNFIEIKDKVKLGAEVPIPVLVGWGSQKTQFQGPKQKNVPDSRGTSDTSLEVSVTESIYIGTPRISWRGNSEMFVVNYHENGQRYLKVFDSDLHPLNQSEPYTNLQEPVAFMGQGQSIACCSVKNGVNQLVIFEKNCKVKAEFDLSEITGSIVQLLYHPIMNMLAIGFFDADDNGFINIYLYSNGVWFLKQQLHYTPCRKLHHFHWMNLQEQMFTTCKMIVFTSRDVEYHNFRFTITRCPLTGTVIVVNGRYLEFYLFDKKITPPPMPYSSFKHDRTINRVVFHPTKKYGVFIDSFFHIGILTLSNTGEVELYGRARRYCLPGLIKFLSLTFEGNTITLLLDNAGGTPPVESHLKDYNIIVKTETKETSILLPYTDTNLILAPRYLDYSSKYIYLTQHEVDLDGISTQYEFALSSNREFFVNDNSVCNGVTSFYIFEGYLIFTHSSAQLYCIRLKDHSCYTSTIHLCTIFSRDIEQGGVIVTCTNVLFPQIILQMPRGNLETIGCKLITIDVIEKLLQQNKWEEVLQILRTEKVNANVLIDLNPDRFREHIPDFVHAAKNNTVLSNIVTEFNISENCFQTFYKNYSPLGVNDLHYDKKAIIEDILKYLVSTDCINNLASIVAIQQKHISLKSALKSIKDILNADKVENDSKCSKVVKQLMVQEHFKDIENAAYNLYDLDFLIFLYQNSAEDPKIYEPEIRNYRNLGAVERRFRMSLRGRNLTASVKYLLRSDTIDESFITNFIIKNRLEDVAYFSIQPFHKHFELVSFLYANRLSIMKKHAEAGMLLKRAGLYKEALQEYVNGLEWREVTSLCALMELTEEETKTIYKNLATDLVKDNQLDDAVILLETYSKDPRAAIDMLVEQNSFRKAMCLAETYREFDLIANELLEKLTNYVTTLKDKIDQYREQFEKYADRLEVVRDERSIKLHAISIGHYEEDKEDLFQSETASSKSKSTLRSTSKSRISTMSSKIKRKEDRKKIDLKHGGYYEDIALIRVLHLLYKEVFDFGQEIKEVCLIHNFNLDLSKNLHKSLSDLHRDMIKRIPEIWSETFLKEENSNQFVVAAVIQNKQDLDPDYCVPPSIINSETWKLEIFSQ